MNTDRAFEGSVRGNGVGVSVIVPVYLGVDWIETCLASLARQTLEHHRFEVILVFNGPPDGALEAAERFCKLNSSLQVQKLQSAVASAPHARNLGALAARGDYVTWVDCDDWVSAEYLELLLLSARPGKVPLAQIVNVSTDGVYDAENLINRSILQLDEHIVSPAVFPRGLTFMTCKLLPTWMAKAVPFDESLRSGEDVALYARMFAEYSFEFNLIPALAGAKYFRLMRDNSVSRQAEHFDFMVTQRLDVISSLNQTLQNCRKDAVPLVKSFINSQASFVRRYCEAHPHEASIIADQLASRMFTYFPWTSWYAEVARLVIAYNFLPYADTGAIVAAKRIRKLGQPVDVVAHKMDGIRQKDANHHAIAQPYVQFLASIDGAASFASYRGISDFCRDGMQRIASWQAMGRKYKELYSRAVWPASHFLAALYKIRNPEVFWVAEFSDPIQLDSSGKFRSSPIAHDSLVDEILSAVDESDRLILASNLNVYFWAEHLTYILADKLIFTNANQLKVMAGYADSKVLGVLKSKSVVSEQPTLEPSFYRVQESGLELESRVVNIGYFGEFYATRNLDEVLESLSASPEAVRSKVRLHIFTSDSAATRESLRRFANIESVVQVKRSLGYFQFLSALTEFDCLIVNDAKTDDCHEVNPYLPSKLSDYRGAGTRIWAVVEDGSVLSTLNHDHVTSVGDVAAAAATLAELVGLGKER